VSATTTRLGAIRGATTADHDTSDSIRAATAELLGEVVQRNGLAATDIVSIIFTATSDLRADFPAVAAREMGLSSTPLLCCQEIPVEGAVARCIRVLVHCYLSDRTDARHVYLRGARSLRLDLPE
jgi:chorismate mutase